MNTQTFAQAQDFKAINDDALIAVNGGGAGATLGWVAANVFTGGIPIAADALFNDGKVTKAAADY